MTKEFLSRREYIKKTLSTFICYTEVKRQVEEIKHAGIVVIRIPGFNNEYSIIRVARVSGFGLAEYFPKLRPGLEDATG